MKLYELYKLAFLKEVFSEPKETKKKQTSEDFSGEPGKARIYHYCESDANKIPVEIEYADRCGLTRDQIPNIYEEPAPLVVGTNISRDDNKYYPL